MYKYIGKVGMTGILDEIRVALFAMDIINY